MVTIAATWENAFRDAASMTWSIKIRDRRPSFHLKRFVDAGKYHLL
jgi:hypothetical protein